MMNRKDEFIDAGFSVIGEENKPNKLLEFIQENHPNIIRDNEIKLDELKAVLGLPIDEKVNGYGLNFVGRNVARAKYAAETEKELRINTARSKDFDTTQNLVLKGDNLDSLKILKSYYSNKIKCIYIDPPYNTQSDEFIYPDKFDKEEAEVLGMANLSESDFERMEFSFKTKQSHNGWLSFMYPRLLLARDLLRKDGVIFISIDDNEQANLKLLCDEVFGEENFESTLIWNKQHSQQQGLFREYHEYVLVYSKNIQKENIKSGEGIIEAGALKKVSSKNPESEFKFPRGTRVEAEDYTEFIDTYGGSEKVTVVSGRFIVENKKLKEDVILSAGWTQKNQMKDWFEGKETVDTKGQKVLEFFFNSKGKLKCLKERSKLTPSTFLPKFGTGSKQSKELSNLLGGNYFENPKPVEMIKLFSDWFLNNDEIILDFFAGSGTTGHSVMQLNAEDGGHRKFILCQLDEPIKKDKPAYKFCEENNLPPVISSITIERLKRVGEKITKEIEEKNTKTGLFEENKKPLPDLGYKVFDSVHAPKMEIEDGNIIFPETGSDPLSRIYNMVFSVGINEPTATPECVVEDCIYKINDHFYITNSAKATSEDISHAIKNGKVFIDGWTADINTTLQQFKEDIKIVF